MGNTVARCGLPVISVHHDDGRVSHFMAPVSVADLLQDHPDYFVVTITNGRKNILTPSLELHHGGNYYIIPPPRLFQSMDPLDDSNSLFACNCCWGCSQLPQILATYFSSGDQNAPSFKSKAQFMVTREEDAPEDRMSDRENDTDRDRQSLGSLLGWLTPDAVEKDVMAALSNGISTPRRSSFSRYSYEKVKKVDSGRRSSSVSSKSMNSDNTNEKPRSSFEKFRNLSFPKEKWLEDMIKGAENQWKRVQLDLVTRSTRISTHKGDDMKGDHPKPVSCRWLVLPLRKSTESKKDQILAARPGGRRLSNTDDELGADENRMSMSRPSVDESRPSVDEYRTSVDESRPSDESRLSVESRESCELGDSARSKKSLRELWLEIEKLEQLEQKERDLRNKQSLRLKIGEVERQIMRSSSVRNAFQMCVGGGF